MLRRTHISADNHFNLGTIFDLEPAAKHIGRCQWFLDQWGWDSAECSADKTFELKPSVSSRDKSTSSSSFMSDEFHISIILLTFLSKLMY